MGNVEVLKTLDNGPPTKRVNYFVYERKLLNNSKGKEENDRKSFVSSEIFNFRSISLLCVERERERNSIY